MLIFLGGRRDGGKGYRPGQDKARLHHRPFPDEAHRTVTVGNVLPAQPVTFVHDGRGMRGSYL